MEKWRDTCCGDSRSKVIPQVKVEGAFVAIHIKPTFQDEKRWVLSS
jgi:hypothetical protein